MRTLVSALFSAAIVGLSGCSSPECRDDEIQVGETCYPKTKKADASAAAAAEGDGGAKATNMGIDSGASGEADAALDHRTDASDPSTDAPNGDPAADAGENTKPPAPCDGGAVNACGGCETLDHSVGDACSNGGTGPCAAPGTFQCVEHKLTCNAPPASPQTEVCDGVDNDCDGTKDDGFTLNACGGCGPAPVETCNGKDDDCDSMIDEADATDTKTWYPDCDGDGYAVLSSVRACAQPAPTSACKSYVAEVPVMNSTVDCRDDSDYYNPGRTWGIAQPGTGPWAADLAQDFNCDGKVELASFVFDTSSTPPAVPLCTQAVGGNGSSCEQRPCARYDSNSSPIGTNPRTTCAALTSPPAYFYKPDSTTATGCVISMRQMHVLCR